MLYSRLLFIYFTDSNMRLLVPNSFFKKSIPLRLVREVQLSSFLCRSLHRVSAQTESSVSTGYCAGDGDALGDKEERRKGTYVIQPRGGGL